MKRSHYKFCDRRSQNGLNIAFVNKKNIRWIVSYDNVPEIRELYKECKKTEFSFKHTAYQVREGKEIMFFSENITQPDESDFNPIMYKLKRLKYSKSIEYKSA